MKIVITECDHDSFAPEHEVAEPAGVELVLTQSRTAAELVANAAGAEGILVQYAPKTPARRTATPRSTSRSTPCSSAARARSSTWPRCCPSRAGSRSRRTPPARAPSHS